MRCGVHGLAAGPDGSCSLCRRGESARPPATRFSALGILLGAIAVLCVSAIGYTALRRAMAPPEPPPTAESSPPSEEPTASEPEPEAAEAPEVSEAPRGVAEAREIPEAPRGVAEAPLDEPPLPAAEPAAFEDQKAASDPQAPALAPAASAGALTNGAPAATSPPSQASRTAAAEQLKAAMQRVPVTMYTTNWCGHCERARAFMRANSIRFVEHDVEASASAKQAHKRLNPAGGVPTIDIDGQVLIGFNEASALHALVAAAQRRMRHGGSN